ncbi:MAG: hypothetical protein IH600_12305 [Bacteroidetes bacterium]|nr:hypothetical protein [Bacteroidota bacterium]
MSVSSRVISFILLFMLATGAQAQRVRGLMVYHYSGQTFVAWQSAGSSVKQYTVYRSRSPLRTALALRQAEQRISVKPGTATNRRLSDVLQRPAYFRLPGPSGTLDFTREYVVVTSGESGKWFYAVTATGEKGEFREVRPGKNATASAVREYTTIPSPVHQGRFPHMGRSIDVFVHWVTDHDIPGYPAMSNIASQPFNFALQKNGKADKHPLIVRMHGRGDNFLNHSNSVDNPQEYVLALDDELPGTLSSTFWFGYDRGLDINRRGGLQSAPGEGVVDYTMRRVQWTIDWALRRLPIDSTRVFLSGISMGGSGVAFSLFGLGSRIAAALATIPRLDYASFDSLETPQGKSAHRVFQALWGSVDRNPRMFDGRAVYDMLNFGSRMRSVDLRNFPPLRVISGRADSVVGWKQALGSMRSADAAGAGVEFFWDDRGHDAHGEHPWTPQKNLVDFARYRGNRSWPAFSRVSTNPDPTLVSPGSWNAAVTWYEPVIDEADRWSVGLKRAALEMQDSLSVASGTLTTDVTPRRLQRFLVTRGMWFAWSLTIGKDEIASGKVRAVRDGELTVPDLPVPKLPSRLEIRSVPGPVFDR